MDRVIAKKGSGEIEVKKTDLIPQPGLNLEVIWRVLQLRAELEKEKKVLQGVSSFYRERGEGRRPRRTMTA